MQEFLEKPQNEQKQSGYHPNHQWGEKRSNKKIIKEDKKVYGYNKEEGVMGIATYR